MANSWNTTMVRHLRPLKHVLADLCIPLFPNTFPFAYHSYALLGQERLRLVDWNSFDPATTYSAQAAHSDKPGGLIYYTTTAALSVLPTHSSQAEPRIIERVHVTTFRPAYVFIDNLLHYQDLWDGSAGPRCFTREVFLKLIDEHDRVEIYSDTEPQATALAATLGRWRNCPERVSVVSCESWDALLPTAPKDLTVRLYFFSPARSALLAGQRDLYIQLECADDSWTQTFAELRDSFETLLVWYGRQGDKPQAKRALNACKNYHEELYNGARRACQTTDASAFTEVTLAYNRIARGQTLRETFRSPLAFAETLSAHHRPPKASQQTAAAAPLTRGVLLRAHGGSEVQPLHVHIGAGSIGLACVVPLLKDQGEKRLLVVNRVDKRFDKDRKEYRAWQSYQRKRGRNGGIGELVVKVTHPTSEIGLRRGRAEYFSLIIPEDGGARELTESQLAVCEQALEHGDVYVLTDNVAQLAPFLRRASTLSTALHNDGQQKLAKLINVLGDKLPAKPIFLFENQNVFQPEVNLPWKASAIHVIVDRICLQRPSKYEDGRLVEHVSCEQDLELRSVEVMEPVPENWSWRKIDKREKDFFEKKKRYLVNSVHTVIAMLGYQRLAEKKIANTEHSRQILSVVLDGVLGDPVTKRVIEVFLAARVQQLLLEVPRKQRPTEFADDETAYLQLVAEGDAIISRMRRFPDEMGRVLRSEERTKIHDRWTRHVYDLVKSVEGCRERYLRFRARERPHVQEIDAALERIRDAASRLVIAI